MRAVSVCVMVSLASGVWLCEAVRGWAVARRAAPRRAASRRVVAVACAAKANGCAVELGCPVCAARAERVRADEPVQQRRELFCQLVGARGLHVRVCGRFFGAEV